MSTIVCPECTVENPPYKQRCEVCYRHLHNPEWRCQSNACLYLNPVSDLKCSMCKKSRNESVGKGKRPQSADRLGRDKGQKEPVKSNFLGVRPVDDKHRRPRSADNRLASRWKCCQCKYSNGVDEDVCEKCNHMKAPCCNVPKGKQWKCHVCDNLTSEEFNRCSNCTKRRKDPDLPKPAKDLDKGKINPVDKHSNDHEKKSPLPGGDKWTCEICSFENISVTCSKCGVGKPRVTGINFIDRPLSKPLRHDRRQSVRAKNLRTIKTRQVEAEWAKIVLNCKQDKINFTDKDFPPNDNSLFKVHRPGGSNIKWKRLKDVKDDGKDPIHWKVYDKPTANDIMQGEIGNCWFICALAVVAERQKLVERIVVTKNYCPEGAYVVRLCKDGIWKTVVLDDHFPVDQYERLKYSKARRGQLWVPLIEKAAAKMHGCYQALGSGRTVESLSLLTGEPCEHLSLNEKIDFSKTIDNMLIWSTLTHARDCRYLMCTSCETKDGFTPEYCKSLGLITGHAYSLLDVYDMDTGEKLLKIRNPWGSESWKGDWSDSSPKWQKVKPEVKQKLKPDGNKHGIFWMEFKDFRKHFGDVDICKTRDWHETRIKGSFPSSADGPWKFVKVYVQNKTDLCVGLHQKNKRGSSSNEDFVDMLIVVMEIMDGKKLRTVGHSKRDIKSYVGCEIEHLERGEYTIACLAFKHLDGGKHGSHVQRDFVLTIHSTQNIVVEENDSINAGYKHFLADTLIQLAVDEGKQQNLKENKASTYSLALDGILLIVQNKDEKEYLSIQEDCSNSRNLMSTRGSMFTQDVIPPGHRQLIFLLTRIDNRAGYSCQSSSSYISSNSSTLEHYGDKTTIHKPAIQRELEGLHIPRPIT
ncbi:calpain-15-like [Mytilus californianus]|uniref:calpain-15-like n=1 Tax=Mytilus californianus TaxID=6549 RepID=UPI0022483CCA|nr:calpain-15-like [Mytilus californianus]XP_052077599.1 calpain-15-like [Mytilus californianus]XP_052077600.1 calpain-15-like [Mytilus californianus]